MSGLINNIHLSSDDPHALMLRHLEEKFIKNLEKLALFQQRGVEGKRDFANFLITEYLVFSSMKTDEMVDMIDNYPDLLLAWQELINQQTEVANMQTSLTVAQNNIVDLLKTNQTSIEENCTSCQKYKNLNRSIDQLYTHIRHASFQGIIDTIHQVNSELQTVGNDPNLKPLNHFFAGPLLREVTHYNRQIAEYSSAAEGLSRIFANFNNLGGQEVLSAFNSVLAETPELAPLLLFNWDEVR